MNIEPLGAKFRIWLEVRRPQRRDVDALTPCRTV